jgi:hypothetical protein
LKLYLLALGAAAALAVPTAAAASTQSSAVPGQPAVRAMPMTAPTNCEPDPVLCGYPDADSTGVTPTVNLQAVPAQVASGPGWHFDPRGWVVVNGNGANLSGLLIPYSVDIAASNVTLRDDLIAHGAVTAVRHAKAMPARIDPASSYQFGILLRHASNVTIEDTTISGLNPNGTGLTAGIKDVYGDSTGLQVLQDNISDTSIGIQVESGLINGNWIHSAAFTGGHVAGVESNGGGSGSLTIEDNTVLVGTNKAYAIGLFEDFGPQANRTVDGNLLAGGAYTIYGGQPSGGVASSDIVVTNNRISRAFYPKGGFYGPATAFNSLGTGNAWSGNFWDDTLAAIPAP